MAFPDENTGVMDGLGHARFKDESLKAALEEVLDCKNEDVIKFFRFDLRADISKGGGDASHAETGAYQRAMFLYTCRVETKLSDFNGSNATSRPSDHHNAILFGRC